MMSWVPTITVIRSVGTGALLARKASTAATTSATLPLAVARICAVGVAAPGLHSSNTKPYWAANCCTQMRLDWQSTDRSVEETAPLLVYLSPSMPWAVVGGNNRLASSPNTIIRVGLKRLDWLDWPLPPHEDNSNAPTVARTTRLLRSATVRH